MRYRRRTSAYCNSSSTGGTIAGQLDCLKRCACDKTAIKAQIAGGKLLYDIDHAIDLYCMGDLDLGMPEVRASAYSYVIDAAAPTHRPSALS
jgi:hypothetical protein